MRSVSRVKLAAVAALLIALTGCGGGASVSGRAVFSHACARCHTLTGHDVNIDGGDLAEGRLPVGDVESFARVMPVHLTHDELVAVARYVVSRERR